MSFPGLGLVGARPALRDDLSYIEWLPLANFNGAFGQIHKVPGDYFEQIAAFNFSLSSSATAGVRSPTLEIRDDQLAVVMSVPAVNTQGPSLVQNYLFTTQIAAGWAPTPTFSVTALPAFVLPSTWSVWFDTAGGAAGDVYSGIRLGVLRVPTGPDYADLVPPAAVPLIV